jgi:hypothetical protein
VEAAEALVRVLEDMARASGDATEALSILRGQSLPDGVSRREAERRIEGASQGGQGEIDERKNRFVRREELRGDFKDALTDAVRSGGWQKAFTEALAKAFDRATERAVSNIIDILFAQLPNQGGGEGGFLSGIVRGIGSIIPGRAGGGPVSAGGIYQVGERGREFFIPSTPGYVATGEQMGRMVKGGMSGAAITQVFNIDARTGADERRLRQVAEEAAARGAMMGKALVDRQNRANSTTG